jgi:hypothetical protein
MAFYNKHFDNGDYERGYSFNRPPTTYPSWKAGTPFHPSQVQYSIPLTYDVHTATSTNASFGSFTSPPSASHFAHHTTHFVGDSGNSSNLPSSINEMDRTLISNDNEVK